MPRAYSFPTVQTVIDQAVSETTGSSTSGLTALQAPALLRKLNQINREFVNSAHTRHHGGAWSWMRDITNFQTKSDTTLNGALTTASTDVVLTSATDFDNAGRIWVKTSKGAIDFIDYTSKSSNTLSDATDIDMAHASGEKVGKCYPLPSDYAKSRAFSLDTTPFVFWPQDALPCAGTFYTRGAYVVLPESVGATDATFWYEKAPTALATGDDNADLARSLDIPEDFMWYAIYSLMAYIQRTRRKRQDAVESLVLADAELEKALNYDVSEDATGVLMTDY